MAGTINKVILVGNVGADPESRSFDNGGKVVNLRIATSESWKDKRSGERKEKTEWHSIAIFNEVTAGFVEQYVSKGDKIYVEGQLQTRKWEDKDGVEKYTTEVVVPAFGGRVEVVHSKNGGERDDRDDDRGASRGGRGNSRGRDDRDNDRGDDRGSRSRSRSDDDGGDGARRTTRRSDDDGGDDRGRGARRGRETADASSSRSGGTRTSHLDDDIPFAMEWR